jgi:hypothetical protein
LEDTLRSLILAPLQSFLGLDRVDDIADNGAAHRQGDTVPPLKTVFESASHVLLFGVPATPSHVDDPTDFLVALEVLKNNRVQGVVMYVGHDALAVTFSVVNYVCILLRILNL